MPLLEADAITIRNSFDGMPEDAKPLASDWMRRYKDQQDEFGLPLFPSEHEKTTADEAAFESMFQDVKAVDPGNGIYDQAERLKPGEGDRLRQREASMRFLAKQYGDEEKVRRDFPLYRDDFAMKNGGKRDMGDGEFYSFAGRMVQQQQGQKLVRSRSLDAGFRAAIEGGGSLEKLAAVQSQAKANTDSEVDAGAFLEAYGETQKVMSKHAPFIREMTQAVSAEMDGQAVDLEPLKERLLDMPGTERRIVLAALRMEADKAGSKVAEGKGGKFDLFAGKLLQQTGEAAARIASNAMTGNREYESFVNLVPETGSVRFSGNAIKTPEDARKFVRESIAQDMASRASSSGAGPGGVGAFPPMDSRNEITLDEGAQRLIQDAKEREMKRLRVANEIRSIGEAADPIPNVFASTIGTSGAALALMAGTRGLAAPALASAYTNIEFNDLSLKYPQMSTEDKTQIAVISGAAQAALDYVGVKALDKLPGLKSLISQPLTRQLAGRALARGASSYAAENVVEGAQDLATPALMAALKSDVPGFDWDAEKRDFWKGRSDVAIGLLPLTLLGIGASSVNEYRGAKNLLSWNDQLGAAGVVETDRVAVIEAAQSGDMGKAQSILMEAWGRRNPEVAAEYQDAMSQRQTDMSRATAELERLGAIPTLRRDGDGWTVTSNGASTKFATWEEARDVATAAMGDMERAQTELVASLSDSFMASTPAFLKGESVEFNTDSKGESLVDRVNAGAMTPEQAMEAAVAGGVIKGITMQEARAIAAEVFGGQNASERAMQFRQDVEKIAVLGRNTVQNGQSRSIVNAAGNERSFLTVVEEVVEGRWKGGLERRAFTKEQGVRWVQLAEAATGEKFLEGSTWEEIAASAELAPRALTEAISRIVVADVLGRMKDGKRISPGTVSSGLNLNDREQSAFAAILQILRDYFLTLLETASKLAKARAEGKLGGEYDALFDALTGGSSQLEHEAGAAKEAQAIIDTSGYSEETPGPNGETFSTSRATPADASNVVQMPDGARLVGPTTFSIRAYHGTPHKVDKFTTAKIGTGEGAQAFGWGLYFAENRGVAKQYQASVTAKQPGNAASLMWGIYGSGQNFWIENGDLNRRGPFKTRSDAEAALLEVMGENGNLYTVELLPDADQFLDWDKPLAEQPEKVQQVFFDLLSDLTGKMKAEMESKELAQREKAAALGLHRTPINIQDMIDSWLNDATASGAGLYDLIRGIRGKGATPTDTAKAASEYLASLGIPGIRYLDGGSRGAGDGTRNYVIFDENLVKILEENGQPVANETFSLRVTPAQDAEYMAAVEVGDMEKAQRMVDEAARAAGYDTKAWHGSPDEDFTVFQKPEKEADEDGFWFSKDRDWASKFGPTRLFYIKDVKTWGGDDFVVKNPSSIKSADPITRDAEGNVIPLSQRFNPADDRITYSIASGDFAARMEAMPFKAEQDAEYLAAVQAGGMEKAQRMVDEAARAAGYNSETLFRGRQDTGNVVSFGKDGAHFTPDREYAEGYAEGEFGNVVSGKAKIIKPLRIDLALIESDSFETFKAHLSNQGLLPSTPARLFEWSQNPKYNQTKTIGEAIDAIESDSNWADFQEDPSSSFTDNLGSAIWPLGFDAIRTLEHGNRELPVVILKSPSQIKSADPVTRDASGNVIPLSKRFNPADNRITFSLRSGDFAARMEAKFSLFQARPELRMAIARVAKERVFKVIPQLLELRGELNANAKERADIEIRFSEEMAMLLADFEADEKQVRDERDFELKAVSQDKGSELDRERLRRIADKKLARLRLDYERTVAEAEKRKSSELSKFDKKDNRAQRDRIKQLLRVHDALLSAIPTEVRPQVGGYARIAELNTDEKAIAFLEDRVQKMEKVLEKWLKKEYLQRIAKLFKRFAPKKDDKGRITSNITAEAAEDIGFAFDFASLDDANQEKEMGSVEKTLEESEDAAEIQDAIGKLAIFQLFHNLEKRESSELEAAAMWLDELGSGAREARKIIDAARAEQVKAAKDVAKADASNGKLSSLPDAENVEADVLSSTFKRFTNDVKGFLNSALFTMGQQLEIVFGQDSRITTEFHRRAVRAANDSTDIKRDIEARRAAFVADLFGTTSRIKQAGRMGALTVPTASGVIIETGGKTKTIDVPAEIVVRIIEGTADLKALGFTKEEAATLADAWADNEALPVKRQKRVFQIERRSDGKDVELRMSQDAAIQYLLWSNQKASREQMERDGWSKESFQQLNAFLSDDARALAKFFADEYARMGRLIEPVYRRMFHAPFPQVANYSPIFRDISKADSIIDIDQQGHGSGVSSGFILARNKNARSALRRTSAISAFMQHAESAAHWIAHVELVRDLRSVLIDKEVQNAIRSSGRTAAANGIKKRVMQLENQGKVGAAGIAELDSWGSRLLQARAFKGLAWRISPVMKQASAYFNPLLADVPAWDYMRGTARLLSGQLDVSAMWNSPDIQRRIVMGFSAEARIAMDKLGYTGSTLLAAMGKGMLPMQLMDAGWTTAGAAVAFDYYRRNNIKSGMNEAQAESAALDQLEMMIAESAQPADPANRSLIEGLQNPWLKSMWMFSSEPRKTLAVEIMALRRLATGKSKNKAMDVQRAVVAHVIMATTTQLMAGVLSLLMGDDDDREREWSVEEWVAAIAAGPINGLFLFGDAFNYIGRRLFGLHAFEPSTAIGQAVKAVSSAPSKLDEAISGEPEEQRKAILKLGEAFGQAASIVGPGNPFTAVDVIIGNPLKDAEKILSRVEE